jgi:hypothetical protein
MAGLAYAWHAFPEHLRGKARLPPLGATLHPIVQEVQLRMIRNDVSIRGIRLGDLGTQFGRKRLNVIVPSLKTRFGAPEPLVIWAQLHAAGSNLAVCLRTGPELLGTVA